MPHGHLSGARGEPAVYRVVLLASELRRISLPETVWKMRPDTMIAYALRYGEYEIPHRFVRPRMALYQPSPTRARLSRSPQATRLAADPRCRLLRPKKRLSLAHATPRVPALEDRLRLVQTLAHRRYLRAPERRVARPLAYTARKGPQAQRGNSGLSVGQDHGSGRH